MSTRPPRTPHPTPTAPGGWRTPYVMLVALLMALTGWLALQEGLTRYLPQLRHTVNAADLQAQAQTLRDHPSPANTAAYSAELAALSSVTDARRFADSALVEHGLYLAHMPRLNRALLTGHIFLGVFCMLLGGLQFWPGLRQRHMRLHRTVGGLYVVTAPLSVLLSLAYLTQTPPERLYTHLTGYVALWLFGLGALAAIALAMVALRRRRIHEHMGWMALSFSCLLVAPMLRLNWVFMAWLLPHIDQETLNLVTLGFMLPQCLLIGHGLLLANRRAQGPARPRPVTALAARATRHFLQAAPLWWALAAGCAWLMLRHFAAGQGLSSVALATPLLPQALAEREAWAFSAAPGLGLALGVSTAAGLAWALHGFLRGLRAAGMSARDTWGAWAVAALSLVAGLSALGLGWQMGIAPARQWLQGGTFYTVHGVLLLGLTLLLARRLLWVRPGQAAFVQESLALLLAVLPAPALAAVLLQALSHLPLPAAAIASGHAQLLATASGNALLALACIHAVLGQATREHT